VKQIKRHRAGIVVDNPAGNRADGPPRHAFQLDDGGLGGVGDEPGDLIVQCPGAPGAVPSPRHRSHDHAMVGAADAWGVGLAF